MNIDLRADNDVSMWLWAGVMISILRVGVSHEDYSNFVLQVRLIA